MGILRDTYINFDTKKLENTIINQTSRMLEKQEKNLKLEIENKKRVSITSQEYDKLRKENEDLKQYKLIMEEKIKDFAIKTKIPAEILKKASIKKVEKGNMLYKDTQYLMILWEIDNFNIR